VVPQEKSEPKRALIAVIATMLGGMLGVFIVFVMAFVRNGAVQPELSTYGSSVEKNDG